MDGIYLTNRSRRRLQGSYNHSIVCKQAGHCMCLEVPGRSDSGEEITIRVERSYTIPGRARSGPYPEEIKLVPQVKHALEVDLTLREDPAPARVVRYDGGK